MKIAIFIDGEEIPACICKFGEGELLNYKGVEEKEKKCKQKTCSV